MLKKLTILYIFLLHDIPKEILLLEHQKNNNIILPINTINLCDNTYKRSSFMNCTYLEGAFQITLDEYRLITDRNNLVPGKYAYIINSKFRDVNTTCKLYFKEYFYSQRKDILTVYSYCIHRQCKCFKLVFREVSNSNQRDIIVNVWSTSLNYNHLGNLTSQLRGLERKMVGNVLTDLKPLRKRENDVIDLQNISLDTGNYDKVKSDCVYRTVRSEQLSKNDRDKNDLTDLILMQKDHGEYVNCVKMSNAI